jgi:hypothetical protein
MQAFIDSFETKKRDAISRNTRTEKRIVGLLEKIKVHSFFV